jgi:crossover junction endodeoxyribonuclease RuvC
VRGVVLAAIAEAGVMLGEYSALSVKSSVVGYGRAEKSQVQLMVRTLTGQTIESEDAADAVAVAICHVTRSKAPVAAPVKVAVAGPGGRSGVRSGVAR